MRLQRRLDQADRIAEPVRFEQPAHDVGPSRIVLDRAQPPASLPEQPAEDDRAHPGAELDDLAPVGDDDLVADGRQRGDRVDGARQRRPGGRDDRDGRDTGRQVEVDRVGDGIGAKPAPIVERKRSHAR